MKTVIFDGLLIMFAIYSIVTNILRGNKSVFLIFILVCLIFHNIVHIIKVFDVNKNPLLLIDHSYLFRLLDNNLLFFAQTLLEYYLYYQVYILVKKDLKKLCVLIKSDLKNKAR